MGGADASTQVARRCANCNQIRRDARDVYALRRFCTTAAYRVRCVKSRRSSTTSVQRCGRKRAGQFLRCRDPAEHLNTEEDMAAYLEAALEEGDPALVAAALGDIARAKGMTQVARDTGLGRESLYKALSASGNPEFATVMKVIAALGLKLHAAPADADVV
jgi:probable addiction module antidote protein